MSDSTPNSEDRDRIADIIMQFFHPSPYGGDSWKLNPGAAADAVLAAGYRRQETADSDLLRKLHTLTDGRRISGTTAEALVGSISAVESLTAELAARTTELTNLEAGFKTFMKSHNQVLDELAEARAALATTGGETAETVEQIEALPVRSVIRTQNGFVYERFSDGWFTTAVNVRYEGVNAFVPAQVLYHPARVPVDPTKEDKN